MSASALSLALPKLGDAEATAAFLLRLRASGVRDLAVLRAMEAVARGDFVRTAHRPHATRNIALPIGCGQTMARPTLLARMLAALGCTGMEAVLEIGSGTGYATALLGRLAARVEGWERCATLARAAAHRLSEAGAVNASVRHGDGLAGPHLAGPYERVMIHGAVVALPQALLSTVAPGGVAVYGCASGGDVRLVRAVIRDGEVVDHTDLGPAPLGPLGAGHAAVL